MPWLRMDFEDWEVECCQHVKYGLPRSQSRNAHRPWGRRRKCSSCDSSKIQQKNNEGINHTNIRHNGVILVSFCEHAPRISPIKHSESWYGDRHISCQSSLACLGTLKTEASLCQWLQSRLLFTLWKSQIKYLFFWFSFILFLILFLHDIGQIIVRQDRHPEKNSSYCSESSPIESY